MSWAFPKWLALIALLLAVLALVPGFGSLPLLVVAVILIAVAMLAA